MKRQQSVFAVIREFEAQMEENRRVAQSQRPMSVLPWRWSKTAGRPVDAGAGLEVIATCAEYAIAATWNTRGTALFFLIGEYVGGRWCWGFVT